MKWRNAVYAGVLVMATIGMPLSPAAWAEEDAPRIMKEEVKALLGNPGVVILDARTGASWESSDKKIKGAVRVDPDNIASWAGSIAKDKKIIVYCSWASEATSASVVLELKKQGFKNAYALKGGWNEWLKAGYPVQNK